MAFTKLYLTNTAAGYTPATLRGAWDKTTDAVTKALDSQKEGGGAIASVTSGETSASNTYSVLMYRGVSAPLAAQTINCNLDVIIGCGAHVDTYNFFWHVHVYATQGDSDTPRCTLLSDYVENTNEWPAIYWGGLRGWALASAQAVNQSVSAGDRIVVELGYIARNTDTGNANGFFYYGTTVDGQPVADLTVDGDETTLAGFVSFSSAVTEQDYDARIAQVAIRTLGTQADVAPAQMAQVAVRSISKQASISPAQIAQVAVRTISTKNIPAQIAQVAVRVLTKLPPWVDIADWHAQEYLDAATYPGGLARCVHKLWTTDAGVMIKSRLVSLLADGTIDAVVGTSAEVTSQTPVDATFAVALVGNKMHKLQVTSDTPGVDLWCSPDAKVPA